MPHFLIKSVGEYSAEKSRKRNNKRYTLEADLEPIKLNFRNSAEVFYEKNPFQVLVCGHSHVKDYFVSDKGFEYINNGYAQNTKTYVSIIDGNVSFKEIF
jgi:UDP-2,3-diacylglucosamine hydrolase